MPLPPELGEDAVQRVTGAPAAPAPAPRPTVRRRLLAVARRAARPALRRTAPVLRRWIDESLRLELARVHERLDALERRLDDVAGVAGPGLGSRVRAVEVNQVLQKAEFADVLQRFEELGAAIAPGAGIGGAAIRLSEQREQLHSLDRRLRVLDSRVTSGTTAPGEEQARAEAAEPVAGFDYVGFERRFRGEPEVIRQVQRERYVPLLSGHGPVVDIGCGRGELLESLTAAGVECLGVEPEPGMAAEARSYGLTVHQTDALDFLRSQEPDSLGAVFSAHVVEHLELDYLLEFVQLSLSRLRPGGVFVAETPNPASLIVLGNSYILDPTHVWPLHPSLMTFLCESAGFRAVDLQFHSPATGFHLPAVTDDSDLGRAVGQGFGRLNDVLFGAQDYTVVATKAPAA